MTDGQIVALISATLAKFVEKTKELKEAQTVNRQMKLQLVRCRCLCRNNVVLPNYNVSYSWQIVAALKKCAKNCYRQY
jgi:hypothetical protein